MIAGLVIVNCSATSTTTITITGTAAAAYIETDIFYFRKMCINYVTVPPIMINFFRELSSAWVVFDIIV